MTTSTPHTSAPPFAQQVVDAPLSTIKFERKIQRRTTAAALAMVVSALLLGALLYVGLHDADPRAKWVIGLPVTTWLVAHLGAAVAVLMRFDAGRRSAVQLTALYCFFGFFALFIDAYMVIKGSEPQFSGQRWLVEFAIAGGAGWICAHLASPHTKRQFCPPVDDASDG